MGLCFKIIEIWNLFDIWDFVYWNFWFIQVRFRWFKEVGDSGFNSK